MENLCWLGIATSSVLYSHFPHTDHPCRADISPFVCFVEIPRYPLQLRLYGLRCSMITCLINRSTFRFFFLKKSHPICPTIFVFGRHSFSYAFSDPSFSKNFQPFKSQWLIYVPAGSTFINYPLCPQTVFMSFVWI